VKARRVPQTLDGLIGRVGVSVLFPLLAPPKAPLPATWVGWIPDFQHKRRPEFFSAAERAFRETCFQRIVNEASHVIVSSQDARDDLMRWFPTTHARVSVLQFRTVLDSRWYDLDPEIATAPLQLPAKFLTYPSQLWIHKNHRTVFGALSLLRERGRSDVVLVCTGREYDYRHPEYANELKAEIAGRGLQSHVRLLGLLDRQTQIQVMRKSAAVVQASFFEGWSALVEDARALGKPIFLSDIPVHREQAPARARYFNPESAEELAGAIESEWVHLEPGPALEAEQHARDEQQPLILDFACRFVDVISTARHNGP
jgi:glycosyltransferase involved in cell wall biosynthesis